MPTVSTPSAPVSEMALDGHGSPAIRVSLSATAPKTPPCIVTIFSAASWLPLVGGAAAIRQHHAFEAPVVGFAHGGGDADVGGDTADHQVVDALRAQDQFQIGGAEAALARLVDDRLAGFGIEFLDDVPAGLTAHEDLAAGARDRRSRRRSVAMRQRLLAGRSDRSGRWPFAGVEDVVVPWPHRGENAPDRLDRCAGQRQVIAHLVDITALARRNRSACR
jgi:hypothetical protein